MAKSKWIILVLTGIFSALSVISLSISFATDQWVISEATYDEDNLIVRNLEVSYGLFAGKLDRYLLNTLRHYDLRILCNYGTNKCFYSCQHTLGSREDEFERIMNDEALANCPESTTNPRASLFNEQVNKTSTTTNTSSAMNMNQSRASAIYEKEFLSAGLWLTTVIFLILAIVFASISGLFSLINIWWHPVNFLFSVFGLYIWNGIAVALCSLTMIFWGSLYLIFIANNIGITDTLRSSNHYTSTDLANLGYSFWILFVTIVCHAINIGLIYYRSYLLQREPKPPAITVNKNDSTILVY